MVRLRLYDGVFWYTFFDVSKEYTVSIFREEESSNLKIEAVSFFETLVNLSKPIGVTHKKTTTFIATAARTPDLKLLASDIEHTCVSVLRSGLCILISLW
jgi:hypothetical protein